MASLQREVKGEGIHRGENGQGGQGRMKKDCME